MLLLGFERQLDGHGAELTVERVVWLHLVVVFFGASFSKELHVGAGQDVVQDFPSLFRAAVTFLDLVGVCGSSVYCLCELA